MRDRIWQRRHAVRPGVALAGAGLRSPSSRPQRAPSSAPSIHLGDLLNEHAGPPAAWEVPAHSLVLPQGDRAQRQQPQRWLRARDRTRVRSRLRRPWSCSSRARLRPGQGTSVRRTHDRRLHLQGCRHDNSDKRPGALGETGRRPPRLRPVSGVAPAAQAERVVRGASRSPGSTERGLGFRTRNGNTPQAQVTARWPRSQAQKILRSPGITSASPRAPAPFQPPPLGRSRAAQIRLGLLGGSTLLGRDPGSAAGRLDRRPPRPGRLALGRSDAGPP